MKLSDIKGEEALDVLADLIDPAVEIISDEKIKELYESDAPKLLLVKQIIKGHKKAVIEILAILDGEDPETYQVNLLTLPIKVMEILNDKELLELFRSQGQSKDKTSSGSVTENTGAEEA